MPLSKFAQIFNESPKLLSSVTDIDIDFGTSNTGEFLYSTTASFTHNLESDQTGIVFGNFESKFNIVIGASETKEETTTAITENTTTNYTTTSVPFLNYTKKGTSSGKTIEQKSDKDENSDTFTFTESSSIGGSNANSFTIPFIKSTLSFEITPFDVSLRKRASMVTTEGTITAANQEFTYSKNTIETFIETATLSTYRHIWSWVSYHPIDQSTRPYNITYPELGVALVTEDTAGLQGKTSKPFELSKTVNSFSYEDSFIKVHKGTKTITNSVFTRTIEKEIFTTSGFNGFRQDFPSPFFNNAVDENNILITTYQLKHVVSTNADFSDTIAAYINTKEEKVYNRCSIDWNANIGYTGDFSKVRDAKVFNNADTYLPILYPQEVIRNGFKINFPNDVNGTITALKNNNTFTGSFKFEKNNFITKTIAQNDRIDFTGSFFGADIPLSNINNFSFWEPVFGSTLMNEFKFLGFAPPSFGIKNNYLELYTDIDRSAKGALTEKYHDKDFTTYFISEQNITRPRTNTRILTNNSTESFLMNVANPLTTSVGASSNRGFADYDLIITYETYDTSGSFEGGARSVDALFYNFPIGGLKGEEPQFNR